MKKVLFTQTEGGNGFYLLLAILGAIIGVGLLGTYHIEHNGHWVTGMNQQIIWGLPHVFAIFLIVAASGALNVASIGSVFGKTIYKPLGRLSALVAIALLTGGLAILVLDLGRPDRLIIAMTHYNFRSIFAWNMIFYNGFFAIVGIYIWTMMEKRMNPYSAKIGLIAFVWRLALTTATGSIFGFLVGRQGYDAAIMGPMFVVMSFAYGLAFFWLVLTASYRMTGRELGDLMTKRLKSLLAIFVAGALYFTIVMHLANLYAAEHSGIEDFILNSGGLYTSLFWYGQILIGAIIPLAILYYPASGNSRAGLSLASLLVVLGGIAQMYVTVIGGQAYPLALFPGHEVTSSFADGIISSYSPTLNELLLGIMGIALTLALIAVAVRNLRFMPASLANSAVDPHHR